MLTRRSALLAALAACLSRPAFSADALEAGLVEIERETGGRLGVFALDTGTGQRILAHREDERFAMCSTFKALLAGAILAKVDSGALKLDQRVTYTKADLLSYAPVAEAHVGKGSLTIRELCAAAVEVSDNTAANLLMPFVDGPAGLTRWLRAIGDDTTRLDRNEPELNTNIAGDERDTTTPRAMSMTFDRLLIRNVLSEHSRDELAKWLEAATPGRKRIRAGLPPGCRVGDKTGTGPNGAVNDVAIAWPPDRAPIVVAVYMSESKRPVAELETFHARIGSMLAQ